MLAENEMSSGPDGSKLELKPQKSTDSDHDTLGWCVMCYFWADYHPFNNSFYPQYTEVNRKFNKSAARTNDPLFTFVLETVME